MKNGTAVLEQPAHRSKLTGPARKEWPEGPILLSDVSWNDYLALSDLIGERRIRTFYSDGEFVIMPVSFEHELWLNLIGIIIDVLADEMKVPSRCAGSTTFRSEAHRKGIEPDRCYYLSNLSRIRGKKRLDLNVDPPPDLGVETEITANAEKRMAIYAALQIGEVWRFDGMQLGIYQLNDQGAYAAVERSRFFPLLPIAEIVRFLMLGAQMEDDTAFRTEFRDWVREQIAAGWKQ